ncbi:hypothetical protein AA313_de0208963 [Arthrobotrys entomopaga]|nr:hypothetical protein AA313_de0208963 [Arthrobotrys entomopaga]
MRVSLSHLIFAQLGATALIPTDTNSIDDAAVDYWFPGTKNQDIIPAYPPEIVSENDDFGLLKSIDAELAADNNLSGDDLFDSIVADLDVKRGAEYDSIADDGVSWKPDYDWTPESDTEPISTPKGLYEGPPGLNAVARLNNPSYTNALDTLRGRYRFSNLPYFGDRAPVFPEITETEDEYLKSDGDDAQASSVAPNEDTYDFYGIPPTIGSFNELVTEYDPLEAEVDALLDEGDVTPQTSFVKPKSESLNILGGRTWSDEEFTGTGNLDWVEDYSPWGNPESELEPEDSLDYMYTTGAQDLDDIRAEEFQLDLELERLELERQAILERKAALAAMRSNLSPV